MRCDFAEEDCSGSRCAGWFGAGVDEKHVSVNWGRLKTDALGHVEVTSQHLLNL